MDLDNISLDRVIENALAEDIGYGDVTTLATIPDGTRAAGRFVAKDSGMLCGLDAARRVFALVDSEIAVETAKRDGDEVAKGEAFARISGPARGILMGERVALNLLQHMSGVATATARAVQQVRGTGAAIADTRKTTPGLRALEKYAVRCGGGSNHRFNLADGVLIKDNHIVAAGGISAAIKAARAYAPHTLKIEIEVESLDMVREALAGGADIIMLDNMPLEQMTEAVKLIGGRAVTEASGNMDQKDLRAVAACGVDIISIGALTHTVRALDISLKFEFEA